MPPLIGVTTDNQSDKPRYSLTYDCVTAVQRAGGLPILIPFHLDHALIPQLLDTLDGLLLTGGDDPNPDLWNQSPHPRIIPLNPIRESFELALIAQADRRKLPILGICLGMQLMNIHRGGSLIQFLPDHPRQDPIDHRLADPPQTHPIALASGSILARLMQTESCDVNSRHKQSIGRIGSNLQAVAVAPDQVIEAIEDPDRPCFLGVQWHAENLTDHPAHLALFQHLVEVSAQTKSSRLQPTL